MPTASFNAPFAGLFAALGQAKGRPEAPSDGWAALRRTLIETTAADFDYEGELAAHLSRVTTAVHSVPRRRIDLYTDTVVRHMDHAAAALLYRRDGGWVQASFRELHEQTARLAALWVRHGVQPGARIALVGAPGPGLWIPLLAAFRLGATPIVFPSGVGRGYIDRRLAAAPPDAIAVDGHHWTSADREAFAVRGPIVPVQAPSGVVADAGQSVHGYAPDAPIVEVHGGFAPEPEQAVPVPAAALWTRLATDATFVLPLRPGSTIAAPGLEPSRHPLLFLATLFAGATWVQASIDDLVAEPIRLDIAGVSVRCRDAVISGKLTPKGWARWFKDPSEPYEWSAWRQFEATLAAVTPAPMGQNILFSPTLGGAALFSPPTPSVDLDVLFTPGLDWVLEEPATPGQATEAPAGVLAIQGVSAASTGRIVLSDTGGSYLFSGSMLGGRNATALPVRELSALAGTHPVVDAAVVLSTPDPQLLNAVTTTLLVFVDPARDPRPVAPLLEAALKETIRRDMGAAYLPDRIVAAPLTPRRIEGAVDVQWCRFQLQTGGLRKMTNSETYRLTSLLRRWGETASGSVPRKDSN